MQFYTLNMFMHVYNKRGRDFLHEQFYFKFFTDLILYGDFYIEGNTDVLYIMFYFTFFYLIAGQERKRCKKKKKKKWDRILLGVRVRVRVMG